MADRDPLSGAGEPWPEPTPWPAPEPWPAADNDEPTRPTTAADTDETTGPKPDPDVRQGSEPQPEPHAVPALEQPEPDDAEVETSPLPFRPASTSDRTPAPFGFPAAAGPGPFVGYPPTVPVPEWSTGTRRPYSPPPPRRPSRFPVWPVVAGVVAVVALISLSALSSALADRAGRAHPDSGRSSTPPITRPDIDFGGFETEPRWSLGSGAAVVHGESGDSLVAMAELGGPSLVRTTERSTSWTHRFEDQGADSRTLSAVAGDLAITHSYGAPGEQVIAIDLLDGTERWRAGSFDAAPCQNCVSMVDDVVLWAPERGEVLALDAADGSERWRLGSDHPRRVSAVVGSALVTAVGSRVEVVDLATGTTVGERSLTCSGADTTATSVWPAPGGGILVAGDGCIVRMAGDPTLVPRWEAEADVGASDVVMNEEFLAFTDHADRPSVVALFDGTVTPLAPLPDRSGLLAPTAITDDHFYAANLTSGTTNLIAWTLDGQMVWNTPVAPHETIPVTGSPWDVPPDLLVVLGAARLHVLDPRSLAVTDVDPASGATSQRPAPAELVGEDPESLAGTLAATSGSIALVSYLDTVAELDVTTGEVRRRWPPPD